MQEHFFRREKAHGSVDVQMVFTGVWQEESLLERLFICSLKTFTTKASLPSTMRRSCVSHLKKLFSASRCSSLILAQPRSYWQSPSLRRHHSAYLVLLHRFMNQGLSLVLMTRLQ